MPVAAADPTLIFQHAHTPAAPGISPGSERTVPSAAIPRGGGAFSHSLPLRSMLALGIDIGGTSVKAALVQEGTIVKTCQSGPYSRPDRQTLQAAAQSAVYEVVAGIDASINAIGLCTPGLFDPVTRCITFSLNVPGLVGLNLDTLVAQALGDHGTGVPPATLVTDAYASAFDSWSVHRHPGRFLALALGTGIGGCVLDDGVPLEIVGRSPGHLGQLDVTVHEPTRPVPVGPDGGRGTLEAYLGIAALRDRFGAAFGPALAASSTTQPPLAALVRALRVCHAMFRPNTIALLGGIGLLLQPRIADLYAAAGDGLTSLARTGWVIIPADHAFHAAAGAARLAARPLRSR